MSTVSLLLYFFVMSGCVEYKPLLEVLANNLCAQEISALFSKASKNLVNNLSEVTENLCCVEGVLTENQKTELAKYRAAIKTLVCHKQSFKKRRKFAANVTFAQFHLHVLGQTYACKPRLVKLLAQIALTQ